MSGCLSVIWRPCTGKAQRQRCGSGRQIWGLPAGGWGPVRTCAPEWHALGTTHVPEPPPQRTVLGALDVPGLPPPQRHAGRGVRTARSSDQGGIRAFLVSCTSLHDAPPGETSSARQELYASGELTGCQAPT